MAISVLLCTIVVFIGDILTPLGYAEAILYLVPLLLSSFLYEPRLPFRIAGTCTLLIAAGFALSPPGAPVAYAVLNRTLAVITLWTVAFGLRRLIRDRIAHFQAERRWQLLARQTNDILWDWDLRTNAHWWSENAVAVFGYDPVREPSIKAWQSRLHPKDRSRVLQDIQSAIENGQSGWTGEYQFQVLDGTFRTFLDRGTIIRNGSGSAIRMIGAMIDITARTRAEAALRLSDARFANLVNHLDSVVWEATPGTLAFTFVSPHAETLLGYPVSRWLEDPAFWPDHIHPEDRDATVQACLAATAQGLNHRAEYRMIAADGRIVWVHDVVTVTCEEGRPKTAQGILIDITSQKHLQAALRQSEERLALAAEGSTDAWWDGHRLPGRAMLDPENPIWWSPKIRDILALNESDPFHTLAHWAQRLHPDDSGQVFAALQEHLQQQTPFDVEYRIRTNRGDFRWLRGRGRAIRDLHGEPRRMAGSCQDITDRKIAEEALRRSETQLKEAQRIAGLGSWEWTAESVVTWSDETYRIFGYIPRSVLPSYDLFVESVHPDDRRQVIAALRETLIQDTPYDLVCRILRPSGEARHIRCRGEVTRDGTGAPLRVTGTVEDITDRHLAEAKLRTAYTRLQEVTRQTATVEENERRRIAREIHDELGQLLTAMRFQLASLKKSRHSHASREATQDDDARLNDLLHLSDSMLKQVRHVSTSLRPAILDELGLIPAVQAHAQQFEVRTGIACDVVVEPALVEVPFDDATASAVFRIVQELLTNVLRHARAMAVSISLIRTRNLLTVVVHDNGTGITPNHQTRHDSFGLKGITERAMLLGGTFTIAPHPSEGTVATLHIPLAVLLPPPSASTARSPLNQEGHENPVG
ncbi:MAG: PAS domain-containing protein [Nitrospira sp.]|nr:PAS domain-containing protein [Nitrospira sp.]